MIACLVFYYYFWTGLHISQGYQMVATAKLLLDKCDGMSAAHGPRGNGRISVPDRTKSILTESGST